MRCSTCGHEPEQHDDVGECHVTVLTGWKEETYHFTGFRPCGCQQYAGRFQPTENNGCPHEVSGTTNKCVHCGVVREPSS